MKKYGPWPKKRSSHTACVLNYDQEFPQLLMTGGLDVNTQALGDLWLLSVDHGMWIKVVIWILCAWLHMNLHVCMKLANLCIYLLVV